MYRALITVLVKTGLLQEYVTQGQKRGVRKRKKRCAMTRKEREEEGSSQNNDQQQQRLYAINHMTKQATREKNKREQK